MRVRDELQQLCQIVGTLYSQEGVSIMLRNLALNPWIRTVLVFSNSPLSNTEIGSAGRRLLKNIWENGPGGLNIHKEISHDVIDVMRQNVEFIDVASLDEVINESRKRKKLKVKKYMKSEEFPEAKRDGDLPWPSERVGWNVRGKKLANTWAHAIDRIVRYGPITETKYGSKQKELQNLTWTVEKENIDDFTIPDWPVNVLEHIGLSESMRRDYMNTYLDPKKPRGVTYTYGNRLRKYKKNVDQIQSIVDKINQFSAPRNAYAITSYPPIDLFQQSPCLTHVQVLVQDHEKLNMFAVFRSHDMMKAALLNAYGLLNLQKYIANKTNKRIGSLSITSISAHIYEEDWQMAKEIVSCSIWGRVKPYFDEKEDIDPRGYVRILILNERLRAELVTPEGEQLMRIEGTTAREIALKIAKLNLLSKPDHYCDVSLELMKAEIALKNNQEYVQDRPLQVGNGAIK